MHKNKFISLFLSFLVIAMFSLVIKPVSAYATTYYVDATGGSNSNNGTSTSTPWQTISKVNGSVFSAGDSILFKKGELWREKLTVPSSGSSGNPITFGAYGAGANPIFDGSDVLNTTWTQYDPAGYQSAYSIGHTGNFTDGLARNYRNIIPANISSVNGTKIRVTIEASNAGGGGTIGGASIGVMTAGGVFDSTPTPITWNSGSNTVTVGQGLTKTSDEITFAFDKTKRYGIHFYGSDRDFVFNSTGGAGMYSTSNGVSSDAQVLNPAGLSLSSTFNVFMSSLEVYNPDPVTGVWYTAFASDPKVVWENGSPMIPQNPSGTETTTSTLVSNVNHSYYEAGNFYIHTSDNSDPNTNGKTYETAARTETFVDNAKNWIIVDGIDQRRTAGDTGTLGGIKITGSNNIIQNLSTYDHYRHGFCFYNGAQNSTATNIQAYNSFSTTPICIYQSSGLITTGNTLTNSVIHNEGLLYGGSAIVAHGGTTGNTISNNDIYGGGGASGPGTGLIDVHDSGTSLHITKNRLHGTSYGGGIYLYASSSASLVDYNLIDASQFDHTFSVYSPIRINGSTNNMLYNNTIVGSNTLPAFRQYTNATGTIVKNNIVYGAASYAQVDSGSQTSSVYDNNLSYNLSGNFGIWAGTTYTTFDLWKAGSTQDTHSLNADPLFTNYGSSNFTLTSSSPAINAGVNVGLTSDYIGTLVPQSSGIDIGAYEFLISDSTSNSSATSSPSCGNSKPEKSPRLFQVNTTYGKATLYFSPSNNNTSSYVISYGYTSGDERFGVSFDYGSTNSAISYTINALEPSKTYYFKVRGSNGCMPGEWSNSLEVTTLPKGNIHGTKIFTAWEQMKDVVKLWLQS